MDIVWASIVFLLIGVGIGTIIHGVNMKLAFDNKDLEREIRLKDSIIESKELTIETIEDDLLAWGGCLIGESEGMADKIATEMFNTVDRLRSI